MPGLLGSQRNFIFFDITQNMWVKAPDYIETKFFSGGFNVNLFYDIRIFKSYISLAPGISFSNATVKSNTYPSYYQNSQHLLDSTGLTLYTDSSFVNINDPGLKLKFSTSYLDIPIELRFRIKPDQRGKNFWIAPGFRAGILLGDFFKYNGTDIFGNPIKFKQYKVTAIENFHYGISLRAGYYKDGVYVFYSLTNLFEKNKGTEVTPFSAGITLTPF